MVNLYYGAESVLGVASSFLRDPVCTGSGEFFTTRPSLYCPGPSKRRNLKTKTKTKVKLEVTVRKTNTTVIQKTKTTVR